jgi:hypothetical protein
MPTTLPSLTRSIDDYFVSTWYEIRPTAVDQILDAIVMWAALKDFGCMTTQVGGEYITRTVRYGEATTKAVVKGDVLNDGEPELETMARWTWRYLSSHVQRSAIDDQKNNGKNKIKSLVATRLQAAKEAMEQDYEAKLLQAEVTAETGKEIQGFNDIVPAYANRATGTYGAISRANTWWQPKYKQLTAPYDVNLLTDMKNLYNTVHNNQTPPNLIITDQTLFELYEDFALDASQIVKSNGNKLADLGFEVLMFKGKPMIWTPNITANNMLFMNMKYVELVYDPQMWFDMTEWKAIPKQLERIAHIISACNLISSQLRRHGRLYA